MLSLSRTGQRFTITIKYDSFRSAAEWTEEVDFAISLTEAVIRQTHDNYMSQCVYCITLTITPKETILHGNIPKYRDTRHMDPAIGHAPTNRANHQMKELTRYAGFDINNTRI